MFYSWVWRWMKERIDTWKCVYNWWISDFKKQWYVGLPLRKLRWSMNLRSMMCQWLYRSSHQSRRIVLWCCFHVDGKQIVCFCHNEVLHLSFLFNYRWFCLKKVTWAQRSCCVVYDAAWSLSQHVERAQICFLSYVCFPVSVTNSGFFLHQGALCFELWPSTCSWSELDV